MTVSIREAMTDPALFGGPFGGESWAAWRALLAGFYGLPLDEAEAEHWRALTGRTEPPQSAHDELWLAVGRRGGKSQAAALMAVYEAAFRDHAPQLAPGEVATVAVLAADRKQARTVMRYVAGLLRSNPMLGRMVTREDREAIELNNRSVIEITTASFRQARGYTFGAVIADEVAFWRSDDSANPDHEILAAVRPGLATLGGPLVCLSRPYAKRGALWDSYRQHYGQDSAVLVAQAPSRTMNPTLPQRVVDDAMARDPDAARAEYGAEFRSDLEAFVAREVIEAAVRPDPLELPFDRAHRYAAFVDPAGGGADEFALAIGHMERERVVVDVLRARHGTPAEIVAEFAELLKGYSVTRAVADRYAGSWPSDEFARHGIQVSTADKAKSDLYVDVLAVFNSARIELPPDDRLVVQFVSLERRTARGGRDSIDHPRGGHDDRANAVAGLAAALQVRRARPRVRSFDDPQPGTQVHDSGDLLPGLG